MPIPFADEKEGYEVISTGLPQLDRVLGIGGIPFKKITEISGQWSVGKTSLAYSLIKSAQEEGHKCIWVDAEWSWDGQYAKALGVDTSKLMLLQTRAAEDSLDELLAYVEKGKDTLIVIDAVGALHPREEAEKDSGSRTIGAQSSLVARFCRKIVPMLALNNNALVVLNHEYTPIEANGGRPQVKTSGGKKLEYHKSIWIRLKKSGTYLKSGTREDGSPNIIGFDVEAEIQKNKCAPTQRQSCSLEMYYGKGFNPQSDLLKDALEAGKITKQGNSYFLSGEKVAVGMSKLREWAKENPDVLGG
jgi:recombination protein RecA